MQFETLASGQPFPILETKTDLLVVSHGLANLRADIAYDRYHLSGSFLRRQQQKRQINNLDRVFRASSPAQAERLFADDSSAVILQMAGSVLVRHEFASAAKGAATHDRKLNVENHQFGAAYIPTLLTMQHVLSPADIVADQLAKVYHLPAAASPVAHS